MFTLRDHYKAARSRNFKALEAFQIAKADSKRPHAPLVRKPRPIGHGDVLRTRDITGEKLTFVVSIQHDDDATPPWERSEGHGPVTEWTSRDKSPGERVLASDGRSKRFYDWQEAVAMAKRDGWGLSAEDKARLAARLGREPTRKEIAVEAVELDFEFLRRWCNDQWYYVGVCLFELPRDGKERNAERIADRAPFESLRYWSVWGVESDCADFIGDMAIDLLCEARS